MTRGFDIKRFKPGTKLLRLKPASSGDYSWVGQIVLLHNVTKQYIIVTIFSDLGIFENVELEIRGWKHGWIRLEDYNKPGLELPTKVVTAIKNKNFCEAGWALRRQNRNQDIEIMIARNNLFLKRSLRAHA